MEMSGPNVLMIYPEFRAPSFWNLRRAAETIGARYPAPPLGLMTVAALLPAHWTVRLVDLNVESLDSDVLGWADLVMTGGMLPQQVATREILSMCRARGLTTVVGGPDPTSTPEFYEDADFLVLGEVEDILADFVAAYEAGARNGRFEAPKFQVDVTRTPLPRFDLIDFSKYLYVNVQYSRGCPFTCEFCDIIELYGRKPRAKTNDQILAELDRLRALGYVGHIDFVDDNLIGNKKALKSFLPELVAWQERNGRPFEFSTEASLNLADDEDLMELMAQAGFFGIFVGIESPDPDVLVAMRKKQNTRRDIAASLQKIYDKGMFVVGGFILGLDGESAGAGEQIAELIEEAALPVAMAGLLYALPNTQLTRRLQKEGRLYEHRGQQMTGAVLQGDQTNAGLNFVTERPRVDILSDYRRLVRRIYAPEAFFARVRDMASRIDTSRPNGSWGACDAKLETKRTLRVLHTYLVRRPQWRREFLRTILHCLWHNPKALRQTAIMMLLYLHLGEFALYLSDEMDRQIAEIEEGTWPEPGLIAAE